MTFTAAQMLLKRDLCLSVQAWILLPSVPGPVPSTCTRMCWGHVHRRATLQNLHFMPHARVQDSATTLLEHQGLAQARHQPGSLHNPPDDVFGALPTTMELMLHNIC